MSFRGLHDAVPSSTYFPTQLSQTPRVEHPFESHPASDVQLPHFSITFFICLMLTQLPFLSPAHIHPSTQFKLSRQVNVCPLGCDEKNMNISVAAHDLMKRVATRNKERKRSRNMDRIETKVFGGSAVSDNALLCLNTDTFT